MKFYFSGIDSLSLGVLSHVGNPPIMPAPIHFKEPARLASFPDIFSDSGAYTILKAHKGKFDLDSFADRYIDYISACPKHTKFIELDVENNGYSMKKVDAIYNRLCNTGREIVRVWHRPRGMSEWKNYCFKDNFFCISVFEQIPVKTLSRMVWHAVQNGARVHGLGCGTPSFWAVVPFYSCDASSWYTPLMNYGQATIWNEKKMKFDTFQYSSQKHHPKSLEAYSLATPGRITQKTAPEMFLRNASFCARQFLLMKDSMARLWKKRGVEYND